MAELLIAGDSEAPNPVSMYLRETLPQEYTVVSEPTVHQRRLDAVVIGPNGIIALQVTNGGQALSAAGADETPACSDIAALQAFVGEEFPSLRPAYRRFTVERDPVSMLSSWEVVGADSTVSGSLAEAITSSDAPADPALTDESVRDEFAVALRDRRLTTAQRATRPFVFRSSRLLGSSAKAWTIRDVVVYMDRNPDDGIYHLNNGTLERWLREEGAPHLAQLAHNAMDESKNDRRRALEIFLVGTGLVARPRLMLPRQLVDLGYVLNGAPVTGLLRLQQGRGRGYLFGSLAASETWLRIDPKEFAGRSTDVVIAADTSLLLIVTEPVRVAVVVSANASDKPIRLPVQFHIVTSPSPFNRFILRPLAALIVAGLLGAFIGGLFALAGVAAPALDGVALLFSEGAFWLIGVGLLWALLGLLRGVKQPPAWPIHYATRRWLARTSRWMVLLAVVAMLAVWGWGQESGVSLVVAAFAGLAAAGLPATIGELQAAKALANPALLSGRRRAFGSIVRTTAGVLLLFVILSAPRLVVPTVESPWGRQAMHTLQTRSEEHWQRLDAGVDDVVTRLYLRYYDRRVPIQPPPTPTSASKVELGDLLGSLRASR